MVESRMANNSARLIRCSLCDYSFENTRSIFCHMRKEHNKKENSNGKVYTCLACNFMHVNEAITQAHNCITHQLAGSFAVEHPRDQTVQEAIRDKVNRNRFRWDIATVYGR